MTVEIGKDRENIRYKYYYTDDGVKINNINKNNMMKINSYMRNEYNRIYDGIFERSVLEDNPEDVVNEMKSYNIDEYDFKKIQDYLDDNILIYEWFYLEQLLPIMVKINLTPKTEPLVFEENIFYVDESIYDEGINYKKKEKKNKKDSWRDEQFEREAKLWGLSDKDKDFAKKEGMSPADFIEAEERDDDELFTDEWE